MPDPVYLDHNATTPIAPEVLESMLPVLRDGWGNPSSGHAFGSVARRYVDQARARVAGLLGCDADEVVFTSGGTESDNAALFGVAEALGSRGRHVVVSNVEHPAIEEPCRALELRGFRVTRVPVGRAGAVPVEAVTAALDDETILVSVMHANNETGVLQPIPEIAAAARARGILVHTDAAQSAGKIDVSVGRLGVDLLTVAGHKLYAPKGVGALYVRRGTPLEPFLRGAGHERGRRAGTENVAGVHALGVACELARREAGERAKHLLELRELLETSLRAGCPDLVVHGAGAGRLPNTLSVAFPGVPADELIRRTGSVAMAAGAACHAGEARVSSVLRAMRVPVELALSTLRLSVGRPTSTADVERAARAILDGVERLRPPAD